VLLIDLIHTETCALFHDWKMCILHTCHHNCSCNSFTAQKLLHDDKKTSVFISCTLSHEMACTCSHAVGLVLEMGAIPVTSQATHTGQRGWHYQLNQKSTPQLLRLALYRYMPNRNKTSWQLSLPNTGNWYMSTANRTKETAAFLRNNNTLTPLMEGHATMSRYCTTFSDNQLHN